MIPRVSVQILKCISTGSVYEAVGGQSVLDPRRPNQQSFEMSEEPKAMPESKTCPITGAIMEPAFQGTVLGKYPITYYYCKKSGLLQTETPYWLDEAYRDAIANADTGLASRNIYTRNLLEPVLHRLFKGAGKFLDVGGGYGLLTRLLRDIGFDCYTTDKHCQNLFAKTFEPEEGFKADALFAFEVLEHIVTPKEFLEDIFSRYACKTLIFSTLTFEGAIPERDWWYYAFDSGQHVSFYQTRTLELLAGSVGCKYYQLRRGYHLITDTPLSKANRLLFSNRYLFKLYAILLRFMRRDRSKTMDDHFLMKKMAEKP